MLYFIRHAIITLMLITLFSYRCHSHYRYDFRHYARAAAPYYAFHHAHIYYAMITPRRAIRCCAATHYRMTPCHYERCHYAITYLFHHDAHATHFADAISPWFTPRHYDHLIDTPCFPFAPPLRHDYAIIALFFTPRRLRPCHFADAAIEHLPPLSYLLLS